MRNHEPLADPPAELAAESVVLRTAAMILWPSFMAACLLEALVFALIDPSELHWPGQQSEPTRQSVYSVAFFLFWIICIVLSVFTFIKNYSLIPLMGVSTCLYLLTGMSKSNWLWFFAWLALGLIFYFLYISLRHF
jgi:hypothetical protein